MTEDCIEINFHLQYCENCQNGNPASVLSLIGCNIYDEHLDHEEHAESENPSEDESQTLGMWGERMKYSYLKEYAEKMQQIADECVNRVLKGQEDGIYVIKIANLKRDFVMESLDENLLLDMLSEREEIDIKDCYDGNITVAVFAEYVPKAEQTF